MYLMDRRAENPHYVDLAEGILAWAKHMMVVYSGLHPGILGLVEQSYYVVVLTHHELRFPNSAPNWGATGDKTFKETAEQIVNSVSGA